MFSSIFFYFSLAFLDFFRLSCKKVSKELSALLRFGLRFKTLCIIRFTAIDRKY